MEINCDLGEVDTIELCEQQSSIMVYIDRCNISCGRHAGSIEITDATVQLAHAHSLRIGAHPSYDDRESFGRISLNQSFDKTLESIRHQLSEFTLIASRHEISIDHVKLHGALYNDVESNSLFANRYLEFIQDLMPNVSLLGLAGGELQKAVQSCFAALDIKLGTTSNDSKKPPVFIAEAFVDRAYLSHAQLAPRNLPGAVHTDLNVMLKQAKQIICGEPVETLDGAHCLINAQSLCLHGDHHDALQIAQLLRNLLSGASQVDSTGTSTDSISNNKDASNYQPTKNSISRSEFDLQGLDKK
jgi:5-oxoprolinase (ATP-hydrolysing) subunit A